MPSLGAPTKRGEGHQIEYKYLQDLPLSLITPLNHPLAQAEKRKISPADWAQYPLIVGPEGTYARHTLDHLLDLHYLRGRVRIVMETPLLDSIRQYVAAGMGIALVHIGQQKFPDIRLHIRPLTDGEDFGPRDGHNAPWRPFVAARGRALRDIRQFLSGLRLWRISLRKL